MRVARIGEVPKAAVGIHDSMTAWRNPSSFRAGAAAWSGQKSHPARERVDYTPRQRRLGATTVNAMSLSCEQTQAGAGSR